MENITTQDLNKRIDELKNLIYLFGLNAYDKVTNEINLIINETCDDDTKALFKGFDNSNTNKAKRNILIQFINLTFDKIFLLSHNNNIYFNECSFTVYESTFENRFNDYKITFVDFTKIDFAKHEIEVLVNKTNFIQSYFNQTNQKRNIDSFNKKIEFLQLILSENNVTMQVVKKPELFELFVNKVLFKQNQPQQTEPDPLDLSNTSAVEKIIYLNELGIIDFLRSKPEFESVNLMATFLSAITDEKPLTLQTSLNRLLTNDTADKNHPYQTRKTVNRVRQTLIDKNIKPRTS